MAELTDEKRAELRHRLAEIEAATAGMSAVEKREYMIGQGYAREASDAEVEAWFGGWGHTTITLIGEAKERLHRGDVVKVQTPAGSWQNQMRAVGTADGLVYVSDEAEYHQAEAESREPLTIAYPVSRVKLAGEE